MSSLSFHDMLKALATDDAQALGSLAKLGGAFEAEILLSCAARDGRTACALALLEAVGPSDPSLEDPAARAFLSACEAGRFETALALAKRCNVEACAPKALLCAAIGDEPRLIEWLLPRVAEADIFEAARQACGDGKRSSLALLAAALPENLFGKLWSAAGPSKPALRPLRQMWLDRAAMAKTAAIIPLAKTRPGL